MSLSQTLEEAVLFQSALETTAATGGEVVIRGPDGSEFILEEAAPNPLRTSLLP